VAARRLARYENRDSYTRGAQLKAENRIDVRDYILLEGLELLGLGPSYAEVAAADAGLTLSLKALGEGTNPATWQMKAPNAETRREWGMALLQNGCARPALPDES
jgi:hypothetical protein